VDGQYLIVPTKEDSEVEPQQSCDIAGYETAVPQNVSAHELTLESNDISIPADLEDCSTERAVLFIER